MMEIPVYLFTGFLGSGKTTFIQDTLESEEFNEGERTLLLICEEGEAEYAPERFYDSNVFPEVIEDEADLEPGFLDGLLKKHRADRVVVEYNGMWMLDSLYINMPEEWLVYQEMMFAEAPTFEIINRNMRQQVFDKLKSAELVVFNRCSRDDMQAFEEMQLALHKIVRVASQNAQIVYEFGPDDAIMDNIEDPLPYDINAPVIVIKDDMYAVWYRDINDKQDDYEGKTLRVKGRVGLGEGLKNNEFVFGRHVMTCCVQDIRFAGLLCKWTKETSGLTNGEWVKIKAKVKNEFTPVYNEVGPVLYCEIVAPAEPANPEVATF